MANRDVQLIHTVGYLHRTARDFVESDKFWPTVLQTTNHDAFKAEERWANANLWMCKFGYTEQLSEVVKRTELCIKSAIAVQRRTGIIQKAYLDEVWPINMGYEHLRTTYSCMAHYVVTITCMQPGMGDYLALTLESADPKDRELVVSGPDFKKACNQIAYTDKKLAQAIWKYYRTPRVFRWLRRRPKVGPYE
jgi:hypothetical protein